MPKGTKKSKSKNYNRTTTRDTTISLKSEIVLLICLLFSILIFISNLGIDMSYVNYIGRFFFGLFGISAYIFPIVLFAVVFLIVASHRLNHATARISSFIIFTLNLSLFSQLIDSSNSSGLNLIELFDYSFDNNIGGGLLGGLLYKGLFAVIGKVGIILFCIFCFIICGVIFTGKSFLSLITRKGTNLVNNTRKEINSKKDNYPRQEGVDNKKTLSFKMPVLLQDEKSLYENSDNEINSETFKPKPRRGRPPKNNNKNDFSSIETKTDDFTITGIQKDEKPNITIEHSIKDFNEVKEKDNFKLPPIRLFKKNTNSINGSNELQLRETALKLQNTLKSFGVNVNITDVSSGPAVTRYEFRPEVGVKVSRILALTDDIKLNLAVNDIRIEAPVPGKSAIGIEVPNENKTSVLIRDLLESKELIEAKSILSFAAGKDVSGKVVVSDLAKMPHMLISGTTGSGKSVFTNSILITFLSRCKPSELKFIVIDPKVVEFGIYNGIPNLVIPVVTDPKKAAGALNWAVSEMSARYKKFADMHVRDIDSYNKAIDDKLYELSLEEGDDIPVKIPRIVIIIDELADLMMVAAKEVEEAICRLAQLARAAGIHMIIATQRPSVDVITGLIKANVPSRVALTVASGTDSRTILDMNGAEKLLGNGDMLFYPSGYSKPLRIQGAFVSDKEISDVIDYLKSQSNGTDYDETVVKLIDSSGSSSNSDTNEENDDRDELFYDAGRLVCDKQKASIGSFQRVFRIGFNRAARIMDQLCEAKVVGTEQGTKPREILMSIEEFELLFNNSKDNTYKQEE